MIGDEAGWELIQLKQKVLQRHTCLAWFTRDILVATARLLGLLCVNQGMLRGMPAKIATPCNDIIMAEAVDSALWLEMQATKQEV